MLIKKKEKKKENRAGTGATRYLLKSTLWWHIVSGPRVAAEPVRNNDKIACRRINYRRKANAEQGWGITGF